MVIWYSIRQKDFIFLLITVWQYIINYEANEIDQIEWKDTSNLRWRVNYAYDRLWRRYSLLVFRLRRLRQGNFLTRHFNFSLFTLITRKTPFVSGILGNSQTTTKSERQPTSTFAAIFYFWKCKCPVQSIGEFSWSDEYV